MWLSSLVKMFPISWYMARQQCIVLVEHSGQVWVSQTCFHQIVRLLHPTENEIETRCEKFFSTTWYWMCNNLLCKINNLSFKTRCTLHICMVVQVFNNLYTIQWSYNIHILATNTRSQTTYAAHTDYNTAFDKCSIILLGVLIKLCMKRMSIFHITHIILLN